MKLNTVRDILCKQKNNNFTPWNLLEFILLTTLLPGVGYLLDPQDPFFLKAQFPLLLLPPFLMALRYGLAIGMGSFGLLSLGISVAYLYNFGQFDYFPSKLLFGVMVITLVTGEMTNASLAKIRRIMADNRFLNMRFNEFTNAYHVMKVSHDHLKEQLANAKFSLREALQMVREKLQEQHRQGQRGLNSQVAGELLSIFNYFCSTQISAICRVDQDGKIDKKPLAVQGNLGEIKSDDPLIQEALFRGTMVSVLPEMYYTHKSQEELETDLLAVIPIKDVSGCVWGILAVAEMHFTAFQDENLSLMQLIGSYAGDLLSQAENIFHTQNDRQAFINELESSWRMAGEFGITSSIICVTFGQEVVGDDMLSALSSRIRSLDHAWIYRDENDRPVVSLLMMLMAENEYIEFCQSLDLFCRERFGKTIADLGGVFHHREIKAKRKLSEYIEFISTWMPSTTAPEASIEENVASCEPAGIEILKLEEEGWDRETWRQAQQRANPSGPNECKEPSGIVKTIPQIQMGGAG